MGAELSAEHGLYFVAYVAALDQFERVLRRMAGLDDGVVDGLLRFSRAATGGFYWCPPLEGGRLDLRARGSGSVTGLGGQHPPGEGLTEALRGATVVVDVSNSPSFEDAAVHSTSTQGTQRSA